jgi:hypothetical protein
MHETYSAGIRIEGRKIDEHDHIKVLSDPRARDFINATKTALNGIKKTPMGAQLINEINQSNHVVKIYRTADLDDGPYQGGEDQDKSMVVAFDKPYNGKTELHRVIGFACQDLSDRNAIKRFLGLGKAKPRFLKREAIARMVNVSLQDLKRMEDGTRAIDTNTQARLRSILYDFLTPGEGSDCRVAFNHKRNNYSEGHRRYLPMSMMPLNLPTAVALAHELIHAWRCMTGRVLFDYGWEEEAMTVGLPPFSSMKFTENRFRIEFDSAGLAIRPEYAMLQPVSGIVEKRQLGVTDDMQWKGKTAQIETKQRSVLRGGMEGRRAAMGYSDDDDGFDEDWT